MARPIKYNADYFTHDADMRNDSKINALRNKFGLEGYAVWCMTLEVLTDKDYFEYPWNELDIELLSSDFRITSEKLCEIVEYCQKIKLLSIANGMLFSERHQERFQSLLSKRNRDREQKKDIIDAENLIIDDDNTEMNNENDIIADESTQSIKEYNIEEKSKSKNKNTAKKTPISTLILLDNPQTDFEKFTNWIIKDNPNVSKMENQMTEQEMETLITMYGKESLFDIITQMDNKKDLTKKYLSVYRTAANWLKK